MAIINSVIKGKQPVIDTLNVTPTTSAQQITAPSGTDGYSPVNVSAVTSSIDANIVAGNIKKDVQILGVTGSYEGTTPTGTVNITSNGTHNVSSYEYAEVLVPTTAPAYYIEKTKDANGKAQNGSYLMDFSTFTDVGAYVFAYAYYGNTGITGAVDFGSLTIISGQYACNYMFYNCTGITSVNLSSLEKVNANYAFANAFYGCSGITSVDLGSLVSVNNNSGCRQMFSGCTGLTNLNLGKFESAKQINCCTDMFNTCVGLTSVNLGALISASGSSACSQMFVDCSHVASVDLSKLTILGQSSFTNVFNRCSSLASVNISHLAKVGNSSLQGTFSNCTSLTSLSFNGLAYTATNINSAFYNTLQGVTGCTVHFPSDWQTDMANYSNITNGLGGTNTTVLFDLPAVTTLDLSYITEINDNYFAGFDMNNYFANVTSVDLSLLVSVGGNYSCQDMFKGSTILANANLSSLKEIKNAYSIGSIFLGTGLTDIKIPALKTVYDNQVFAQMLQGVTGCTVHFPSNMSSYNFNCGGTNTTVLYDLPATNILTGADTKEYERNPKYDTATALAWRINGTMPNTTTYYTSGLTDPTVGTTIYSDSACTIAETTVDSIS